jgi:large subunit ribosomal protein L15
MHGLHTLKRITARPKQRVGRGQASGRGKQSGRGGKGQTARAGAKIRPALRDIIKKIPKRRGFGKNRGRTVVTKPGATVFSVELLADVFGSGDEISRKTLIEKGLLGARETVPIKIVGGAALSKKFAIKGIPVTSSARVLIEKAGGSIV